jgi:hypothetical protein
MCATEIFPKFFFAIDICIFRLPVVLNSFIETQFILSTLRERGTVSPSASWESNAPGGVLRAGFLFLR